MSTTARRYWLKALRFAGVKNFRASSSLGVPFVCHLGDFAGEVPFYNREHSVPELRVMAAWCRQISQPIVFDIGANNGFIATQLAQLLRTKSPTIFAFEPVPTTFAQLMVSIQRLGLQNSVFPISSALGETAGTCFISYQASDSLFAQMEDVAVENKDGKQTACAAMITVEGACSTLKLTPSLLKIDVEGWEPFVLRGAAALFSSPSPPALCFELNPVAMRDAAAGISEIDRILKGFEFFYIDDFGGQLKPFGYRIERLSDLTWVCNIFAFVGTADNKTRWQTVRRELEADDVFRIR
jgi:FkbM family methyltransferase